MTVKIKICGVTDARLAQQVVMLGADYVGIVCYRQSLRYVTPDVGAEIAQAVMRAGGIPVAVCVDTDASVMQSLCELMGINTVQLAGSSARQSHYQLPASIRRIYVLHVTADGLIQSDVDQGLAHLSAERDYILYDGVHSGSGRRFALSHFHHRYDLPFFLAGGLDSENVVSAINTVQPDFVDVSSGVESAAGVKDLAKVRHFIRAVRGQKHG